MTAAETVSGHVFVVIGTRPEAIKLAPVVLAARARPGLTVTVCNTGQHADMVANVLKLFGITPDLELSVMKPGQSLTDISCAVLSALQEPLARLRPDWLIVQGDTSTAFIAALAGFYHKVSVAHVEAGLRTGDILSPWPEEMNRRLITGIARWHFAPMPSNADNLRREGVPDDRILITGNSGIDALKLLAGRLEQDDQLRQQADQRLESAGLGDLFPLRSGGRIVLITGHRRESFGQGFVDICTALRQLAEAFPDDHFIYPVHPNPQVRQTIRHELGDERCPNIRLIEPLDYLPFIALMARADLILTDSGGVQEEAPSLGKRVVVMRAVTERTEGLDSGMIRLAGTDPRLIVEYATAALAGAWSVPPGGHDVYGDGQAAGRIIDTLCAGLSTRV